MTTPDISVIIGAYNAMPYLTKTLTSVVEQTIGRDRLEIITVNDGSTDGTGDELERFAAQYPGLFQVFHQENSGGPSAPRNKGLDNARGKFVFFLDADDYLGAEALERMLAMAEKNNTDVVLGKMVGVNGRGAPASMFRRNQPRTDVFNSRVYWALNPLKLIRRELIEKHELRFPLGYKTCEDQLFTGMLYLKADGISVVADYDCLFIVKRDDGGNITTTTRGADTRIRVLELMVDMVEKQVPAGPDRDGLMNRHLSIDMFHALIHLARESDPELQKKNYQQLAALLERSYPDSLKAQVNAVTRLRCELIQRGMLQETIELEKVDREHRSTGVQPDVLVEGDRAYTRLPFFRDADRGIPDEIYDVTTALQDRHQLDSVTVDGSVLKITGHAYVRRVSQDAAATELVLRERGSKVEHRFPTTVLATPELGAGKEDGGKYRYPAAGFSAEIDLANAVDGSRLPKGLWDVLVAVRIEDVVKEIRFGHRRLPSVQSAPQTYVVTDGEENFAATLYYTNPYSNLTLDIGEKMHKVADKLHVDSVRWSSSIPSQLEVSGSWKLAAGPVSALSVRLQSDGGKAVTLPVTPQGDRGFTANVPVQGLASGTWAVSMWLPSQRDEGWSKPVAVQPGLKSTRWYRRGLPWYVVPAKRGNLVLRVGRVALVKAGVKRLRALRSA
ncbi:glycosyltransferase [Streptomyces californicus]|uniref:glycosyltransferase n=1 Tax=Streptomyces californicus TaxID=67351 RepID=UPI00296ED107|nr:glycosyltransferase [Streptomyces californicus]MDW4913877.1 glycosyltransferase [Streptomyces californicus]